jgi:ATP-dependent DNA ligase
MRQSSHRVFAESGANAANERWPSQRATRQSRAGAELLNANTRTRNGFTPVTRAQLFRSSKGSRSLNARFANLPEAKTGRWGQGPTKAKMAECVWLEPVLVGQFEFLEWVGENHLRHSKFIALREDKSAKDVVRE